MKNVLTGLVALVLVFLIGWGLSHYDSPSGRHPVMEVPVDELDR